MFHIVFGFILAFLVFFICVVVPFNLARWLFFGSESGKVKFFTTLEVAVGLYVLFGVPISAIWLYFEPNIYAKIGLIFGLFCFLASRRITRYRNKNNLIPK